MDAPSFYQQQFGPLESETQGSDDTSALTPTHTHPNDLSQGSEYLDGALRMVEQPLEEN